MNKILYCFFICNIGLFFGQELGNSDWHLSKQKNGISVYTRKVSYSNYKEFRAEVTVFSNPEKAISLLKNIDDYKNWLPDCSESKKLASISNNQQVNYILTEVPWPYEDRDLIYKFTIVDRSSSSQKFNILIENRPDFNKHKKGIVRIPKAKGMWIIIPLANSKTKLIYQMHIEPGGYVPSWLANLKITDTPYTFLYNLCEELEK